MCGKTQKSKGESGAEKQRKRKTKKLEAELKGEVEGGRRKKRRLWSEG